MFNKKKYINDYVRDNYKTIKFRIRKDDQIVLKKLSDVENINQYLLALVNKDISENWIYNYINDDIIIDFELSKQMTKLINDAEKADYLKDYGLYMNLAYAIDSQAKKETTHHIIRESEWKKLVRRYQL